jgi:hypothetical protein
MSRAIQIDLDIDKDTIFAMATYLGGIGPKKPINSYIKLVSDCNGNMREALQKIVSGVMK